MGTPTHDFDAFWSSYRPAQTIVVLGQEIEVPTDLPVELALGAGQLDTSDLGGLQRVLGDIYSGETVDAWVDAGIGAMQMAVILAWTLAHIQGEPISFADALERCQSQGKAPAPNRATRRAATRSRSSAPIGRPSLPTSAANTASPPMSLPPLAGEPSGPISSA